MLRFLVILCFSALAAPALLAQTPALDSLKKALTTAREDTAKVRLLCRIALEQRDEPALSRKTAEEAYALAERLRDTRGQADAMNRISSSHIQQGSFAEATRAAETSLGLAERGGHALERAAALISMGNLQWRQGNFDAALDFYFRALTLQEEIGNKKGMAAALSNIGSVYSESGNHASALEYMRKSLALHETFGNMRGQASQLNNIGDTYMIMRRYDTAVAYFRHAYAINERMKNKLSMGFNLQNLGEALTGLKNYAEARQMLERALSIFDELDSKDNIGYALRLFAELAVAEGKPREGLAHALRAYTLADSLGARPYKRDALKTLSAVHEASGNAGAALRFYKEFVLLRDSLVNDEITKKAAYRESKYAADKKDAEIKLLKKDAENQALVRNSMAGGLGLVGVLVGVLVFSNNRRRRANTLLQSQATQIQLANTELQEKNIVITEAHTQTKILLTNVNDSIRYAKRIQDAMLPSTKTLNRLLPEHFIFFRPKDVVSGDFYWCKEVGGKVFVAAVDCTGHGVPGAFMSLIGNSLLNDITARLADPHPDEILRELHYDLQTLLKQRETNNNDGMDICLCMIDVQTRHIEFAGAMNPLYAVVDGTLQEFKGTAEELGGQEERHPTFTRHELDLSSVPKGATMLYLTTDGYKDQYNDEQQRFMPKRLRPLLTEIAGKPLAEQPQLLGEAIDAHRGGMFQVDDMLVLGVRL